MTGSLASGFQRKEVVRNKREQSVASQQLYGVHGPARRRAGTCSERYQGRVTGLQPPGMLSQFKVMGPTRGAELSDGAE